ncbi:MULTISPECIES: L-serine ammonia-lyase, iron-sulfur-dependent, subunit alpha [Jonquetella]|uniref:L-serine dehydratase n=1 Tax=Jonquetella anthropi DSM 22815 TaxID=885272 RepID=H0UJG6_9BACT|nr:MULTISPECIES: L-serine ammonia-lyase, iron-sulfur-dependent, subunit alpha [Jonquetella]EEX49159.1 L-serine dehydratase, iron-sulfur-dependent, alpha subunit [Jonquetella anthropi E3_33 E1]EHM13933.1 L-serine dehydratase, iron-sulfur-dependent, alpha subunit [Jonquetella anthropi DSM 22815]ERL24133.1 L-serine dehydratase, iron-sulfur-dependent, alpha subunit [Jonquetella sp. BV3C21]
MNSLKDLIDTAERTGQTLPQVMLDCDAHDSGVDQEVIRESMARRLDVMRESAKDALVTPYRPKVAANDVPKLLAHRPGLTSEFTWRACTIAMGMNTCNASMGRIVAAPTAGSCGILPGMILAFEEQRTPYEGRTVLDALIVSAGIGEVIAARASLAGAEGGCQAECGSAAAMGAAALVYLSGGTPGACGQAVAITIKSITGLVCDPLAGLVEIPCIKRNGMLVSLGILAAELALAGVESFIPVDEMIDVMGKVGRALPPSLRETACGGLAVSPTARQVTAQLLETQKTIH